jgi:branched-chain amino acid transport system permease protein
MSVPHASGYFRTSYARDMTLLDTRVQRVAAAVVLLLALALPILDAPFLLDLANQVLLAVIGSVALMLVNGVAGQISLGHAGLLAAGAFTTGILVREAHAPFWVTLPAAALVGAVIGLIFGLPSLRLRGLYLAVSTLALHFVVIYLGNEYESRRGYSTGVVIEPPADIRGAMARATATSEYALTSCASRNPARVVSTKAPARSSRLAKARLWTAP